MIEGLGQRHIVAADGTRIGYQVRGQGPCLVLANGLGGSYLAFRYLYEACGDYKTICWDYRGLFTSSAPADPRANTMGHHIEDLTAVLEAEQVGDFVIAGWSMGVQVALEAVRRHPGRVRGMFAVCGTYGRALRTIVGSPLVGRAIPTLLRLARAQAGLLGRASRRVAGSDGLVRAMRRVGLLSQTADPEEFRVLTAGFQQIDWTIYSDLLARLDEHDAEDVLATIDVPLTVIAGDRDPLAPLAAAEHIHRAVPHSRFVTIRGGTHYTPVEYPAILAEELGRLLDRVPGWERDPRTPRQPRRESA